MRGRMRRLFLFFRGMGKGREGGGLAVLCCVVLCCVCVLFVVCCVHE
jgi:hypothetical protein